MTKIFFPGARLVRRPIYFRNRRGASIDVGLTTGYHCRVDVGGNKLSPSLVVGSRCSIGDNVHIVAFDSVRIGDDCLMASNVFISDAIHGSYGGAQTQDPPQSGPNARELTFRPVVVGDNVWLGQNVCVLPGARIGSGSIVSANSVVSGEHGPGLILAGAPARPIKKWDETTRQWSRT